MRRTLLSLVPLALLGACSNGNTMNTNPPQDFAMAPIIQDLTMPASGADLGKPLPDLAHPMTGIMVVVNELNPNGADVIMDPDWAELKNLSNKAIDLTGFMVRDSKMSDLTRLPDGTMIDAGAYLVIECDGLPDGGSKAGVHVGFKLSGSKGDEFHLVDTNGDDVDATAFGANQVPDGKSWARIPDGTGAFQVASLTKGTANMP